NTSFTLAGTGTLTLAAPNTFVPITGTGVFTVNMASALYNGTLVLGNNNSLGTNAVTLTGGNLQASSAVTIPNNLTITGGANLVGFTGSQNLTFTGTVANAAAGTFLNTNTGTVTFAGVISGVGALSIYGTGTTVLTATNTITGALSANGGIVSLAG